MQLKETHHKPVRNVARSLSKGAFVSLTISITSV